MSLPRDESAVEPTKSVIHNGRGNMQRQGNPRELPDTHTFKDRRRTNKRSPFGTYGHVQ